MLIQTDKIRHFPVVLLGIDWWGGLVAWMRERLAAEAMISPGDLDLLQATDDPARAVDIVIEGAERQGR